MKQESKSSLYFSNSPFIIYYYMFIPFLLTILALIFGSFFTALIYRMYRQESMAKGRSKCPECQHVLNFFDLFPVLSYAWLGGRCRYCRKKISIYYPLVELGTVAYFLAGYFFYGLTSTYFLYLAIATFLYLIMIFDWRYGLIPDILTIPGIILAVLVNLYLGRDWLSLVGGMFCGFLFFALQYFPSRGRWVGDGDLRMGALMGAILGFGYLWLALFIAYLSGAMVGLLLIWLKGKKLAGSILFFGPFLAFATWVVMLWGEQILQWYLGLIY